MRLASRAALWASIRGEGLDNALTSASVHRSFLQGGWTIHLFETRKPSRRAVRRQAKWKRNRRCGMLSLPARRTGQRWRATRAPKREGVQRRGLRPLGRGLCAFCAGTLSCDKRSVVRAVASRRRCVSVARRSAECDLLPVQAMSGFCWCGRSNQSGGLQGHEASGTAPAHHLALSKETLEG